MLARAIREGYRYMSDEDLVSVIVYVRSIPPEILSLSRGLLRVSLLPMRFLFTRQFRGPIYPRL